MLGQVAGVSSTEFGLANMIWGAVRLLSLGPGTVEQSACSFPRPIRYHMNFGISVAILGDLKPRAYLYPILFANFIVNLGCYI